MVLCRLVPNWSFKTVIILFYCRRSQSNAMLSTSGHQWWLFGFVHWRRSKYFVWLIQLCAVRPWFTDLLRWIVEPFDHVGFNDNNTTIVVVELWASVLSFRTVKLLIHTHLCFHFGLLFAEALIVYADSRIHVNKSFSCVHSPELSRFTFQFVSWYHLRVSQCALNRRRVIRVHRSQACMCCWDWCCISCGNVYLLCVTSKLRSYYTVYKMNPQRIMLQHWVFVPSLSASVQCSNVEFWID
jgi:hypothetical protein